MRGHDTECLGLVCSRSPRTVACRQDKALRIGAQIETGTVFQNRCDYLDPELPWTGVKDTGKGVSLSHHGFRGVTRLKGYHLKQI